MGYVNVGREGSDAWGASRFVVDEAGGDTLGWGGGGGGDSGEYDGDEAVEVGEVAEEGGYVVVGGEVVLFFRCD